MMKKVVAKALVIDADGAILVLYRGATHPKFSGYLDLPGGEVNEGELWQDAVTREIHEETGLTVDSAATKKLFEKSYPTVTHTLFEVHLQTQAPKIQLSWEHGTYKWFSKDELLKTSLPPDADPYFIDVMEYLKNV